LKWITLMLWYWISQNILTSTQQYWEFSLTVNTKQFILKGQKIEFCHTSTRYSVTLQFCMWYLHQPTDYKKRKILAKMQIRNTDSKHVHSVKFWGELQLSLIRSASQLKINSNYSTIESKLTIIDILPQDTDWWRADIKKQQS